MTKKVIKNNFKKDIIEKSFIFYENKYLDVIRHEHIDTFEVSFSKAAFDLYDIENAKDIISEMMRQFETQFKNGFNYKTLILNTLNGGPTIIKESQNYLHETLFPFYLKHNIHIHLFCLSEEAISNISMKLTAEGDPDKRFENHFFSKYEDCISFIKKSKG